MGDLFPFAHLLRNTAMRIQYSLVKKLDFHGKKKTAWEAPFAKTESVSPQNAMILVRIQPPHFNARMEHKKKCLAEPARCAKTVGV